MKKQEEQQSMLPALTNKDDIPKYLDQIKAAIAKIKGGMPDKPKATGDLQGYGKIENIKSVSDLVRAAASVRLRAREYTEAATALGVNLKKYPAKIDGFSAETWLNDIEQRVNIIANKDKLEKLEKIRKTLEDNLSAEAKFARDMASVHGFLNELIDES